MAQGMEQHVDPGHHEKAEVVQHQHDLVVAARNNGQARHPDAVHCLAALAEQPVAFIEFPLRVVGHPAHHVYVVSLLSPVESDVVSSEHLGIEVLTNK